MPKTICAALALALAAGAAHGAQDAAVSEVDSAQPQQELALKDNETFQRPMPMPGNDLPAYPESMLAHLLPPQTVCVRVTINEKGKVDGTAPIGAGPDCPTPQNAPAAFYEAAEDAAKAWSFDPAFKCVYPKRVKPNPRGCFGDDVEEVPTAVSLVYRFVFEQSEGKPAVRVEG